MWRMLEHWTLQSLNMKRTHSYGWVLRRWWGGVVAYYRSGSVHEKTPGCLGASSRRGKPCPQGPPARAARAPGASRSPCYGHLAITEQTVAHHTSDFWSQENAIHSSTWFDVFASAPSFNWLGTTCESSNIFRGISKLLTIFVHAHLQAFLESARLALVSVRLVHRTHPRSGLTPTKGTTWSSKTTTQLQPNTNDRQAQNTNCLNFMSTGAALKWNVLQPRIDGHGTDL